MQGAQKLRGEAHYRVRRNDKVAAQRSRWTFYETFSAPQVGFDHSPIIADFLGRSFTKLFPEIEDDQPVAHLHDKGHVVLDQQNREPFLF